VSNAITQDLLASAAHIAGASADAAARPTAASSQSDVPEESLHARKRRAKGARRPTPWECGPITARGPPELWRLPRVLAVTGLSRSQLYELLGAGRFPRPVTLTEGGRLIGWPSHEVVDYVRSRIEARDVEATP
jgi:prophage regulatory protein